MTQFVPFGVGNALINPDLIYQIDRVTLTVTFTLAVSGMPAGSLQDEDFVFADEATALAALDTFLAAVDKGALALDEIVCCVVDGVLSNSKLYEDITRVATRQGQPPLDELTRVMLEFSQQIKIAFEAL